MAIYTALTPSDFAAVAKAFGLGEVRETSFVPQGSINTNVRLETAMGRYFLRHTTVRSADELRFEAGLLAHLAEAHFPSPSMLLTAERAPFIELAGGRACVFRYLVGEERTRAELTDVHTERLGAELARLHQVTNGCSLERDNPYGPDCVGRWLAELRSHPDAELSAIAEELSEALAEAHAELDAALLPRGIIHADLFMDNVKWVGDRVSAFFDFEMACRDVLVLDLAITLNAWCFDGGYVEPLVRALLRGYQSIRALEANEREGLRWALLFGAVRYTTSRIRDFHLSPLPSDKLFKKDFRTYLARVRALRSEAGGALLDSLLAH